MKSIFEQHHVPIDVGEIRVGDTFLYTGDQGNNSTVILATGPGSGSSFPGVVIYSSNPAKYGQPVGHYSETWFAGLMDPIEIECYIREINKTSSKSSSL